ncbi:MAG: nucleotidyltransferase domain-containing protein, partial [Halioglobus sp.]|nr:nucleotidyltransferase domain-containing protein [Halioglobus sp.]
MFDPRTLASALEQGKVLPSCKQAITTATDYLHDRFRGGASAGELIRLRANFMDTLLGTLWNHQDWGQAELALVAVGGYGRGELHPHSDVDILLLLGDDEHGREQQLEAFLTLLWDIGLVIGHSVRTVEECEKKAREDIT